MFKNVLPKNVLPKNALPKNWPIAAGGFIRVPSALNESHLRKPVKIATILASPMQTFQDIVYADPDDPP